LGAVLVASSAAAQSVVDRSPNQSAGWVTSTGTLQFNFVHRFQRTGAPERKVSNSPTFVAALGLPGRSMVGFAYATNSTLSVRYPNEWEFFARTSVLSELEGAPFDLSAQLGYNVSSEGFDGEVALAKLLGPVRLLAAGRSLSNPFAPGREVALAGGVTLRLTPFLALGGDLGTVLARPAARQEKAAWSAGLQLAIPSTPHTVSVHATNANTATLQGMSRGGGKTRYGFEFTIPITLARYFGSRRAEPAPAARPPGPDAPAPIRPDPRPVPPTVVAPAEPPRVERVDSASVPAATAPPRSPSMPAAAPKAAPRVVRAAMKNLAYQPRRLEIVAGTTVAWKNDDPLDHSVTADDKGFDSGLIKSGAVWRRTFSRPGTYHVTCTPHPFMKITVVVKPEP
jgi:plastocyanin